MAVLNLKDRVIEAKVAYFGRPTRNCSETVDLVCRQMGGTTLDEDRRLVAASLPTSRRVNGCDVRIRLCAGKDDDETTELETLRDADGVVLVVEDVQSGLSSSRAAFERLERELLDVRKRPPIVVQVRASDVADRLAPEAVLDALGVRGLPHFVTRASDAMGFVETLDDTVERIVRSMREPRRARGEAPVVHRPPASSKDAKTVEPEVEATEVPDEHEEKPTAPPDAVAQASPTRPHEETPVQAVANDPPRATLESTPRSDSTDALDRDAAGLLAMHTKVDRLEDAIRRLDARLSLLDKLAEPPDDAHEARMLKLLELAEAHQAVADRVTTFLAVLEARNDRTLEERVGKLLDTLAERPDRAIVDAVDRLGMELRSRDMDLLEQLASIRDRDAATSESLAAIRTTLDPLATEIRRLDVARTVQRAADRVFEKIAIELGKAREALTADVSAMLKPISSDLGSNSSALRKLGPEITCVVENVVAAGITRLEVDTTRVSDATSAKLDAMSELSRTTHTLIEGALEEARQRKKSWFG